MPLRLLHTADWHLGQSFHGVARDYEHGCFLAWLLDRLDEQAADALVIAGDVFDGQNPPVSAQAAFYRFLANAKRRRPALGVVVIAGNHDSGGRLEAPSPLLDAMGVRVVGGLRRRDDGTIDLDRLLVPLADASGAPAALCAAVPYLRPADLPPVAAADSGSGPDSGLDPLIEGVRRVYAEILDGARERLGRGQALVATGHCYMTGAAVSQLSERKILGGNLHALPADIFPAEAAYVALGHLHRAQAVGDREGVRYSGSPLPLALDEDRYCHQVVLAEFEGGQLVNTVPLPVPRFVAIHRLPPPDGVGPLDGALAALRGLPEGEGLARELWPFLEVAVALDRPQPGLRAEIEAALAGRAARLLKLSVRYAGTGEALAEAAGRIELSSLLPEEVFRRIYRRAHDGEPEPRLTAAFHELVETVQGAEA